MGLDFLCRLEGKERSKWEPSAAQRGVGARHRSLSLGQTQSPSYSGYSEFSLFSFAPPLLFFLSLILSIDQERSISNRLILTSLPAAAGHRSPSVQCPSLFAPHTWPQSLSLQVLLQPLSSRRSCFSGWNTLSMQSRPQTA